MLATGATADSATGFADGGLLTGLGAEIGKIRFQPMMANRLTSDNNTSPDRIRYFGDPISALDFNSPTVFPSFKQRFNNSAHPYSGLQIAGKVHDHGTMRKSLNPSPDDSKAEIIIY